MRYRCHYCKNIYTDVSYYCSICKSVAVSVAVKIFVVIIDHFIFSFPILLETLDTTCKLQGIRSIDRSICNCRNLFLLRVSDGKHLEQFQRGIINWYFEMNTVRHLLNNSRVVAIVSVFNIYFAGVIDSHGFHRPPARAYVTIKSNQLNLFYWPSDFVCPRLTVSSRPIFLFLI